MFRALSRSAQSCTTSSTSLFSTAVKRSTGVVGLDVVKRPREVLATLYKKTLLDLHIIPEFVPYRAAVEEFTTYRLGVVESIEDVRDAVSCSAATAVRAE
jgi:hypothetical protein